MLLRVFVIYFLSVVVGPVVEGLRRLVVVGGLNLALLLVLLKQQVVAGGHMVVLVGVQASYCVLPLKAFRLEQQQDFFLVGDLAVANDEALVYADGLVQLEPGVALDVVYSVPVSRLGI